MKRLPIEIKKALLNFIFPLRCQGCGIKLSYDNNRYVCDGCLKDIKLNSPPFCIRCGKTLYGNKDISTVCPKCLNRSCHFTSAWQCCEYKGLIKELIHKFKYNKKLFLKKVLAEILVDFTRLHIDYNKIAAIIPVPMYRINIDVKGFNHTSILSAEFAKELRISLLDNCLIKVRKTKRQVELDRKERLINIKGAFSVKKDGDIKGKRLLLVDDVYTTGATLNECSNALKTAGAESVWVLTLARGI